MELSKEIIVGVVASLLAAVLMWLGGKLLSKFSPEKTENDSRKVNEVNRSNDQAVRPWLMNHLWMLQYNYEHLLVITMFLTVVGPAVFLSLIVALFHLLTAWSILGAIKFFIAAAIVFVIIGAFYYLFFVKPIFNRAASNGFWFAVDDLSLNSAEWQQLSKAIYETGELAGQSTFRLDLEHSKNRCTPKEKA